MHPFLGLLEDVLQQNEAINLKEETDPENRRKTKENLRPQLHSRPKDELV